MMGKERGEKGEPAAGRIVRDRQRAEFVLSKEKAGYFLRV
jgi:hypothetical protein